MDIYQNKQPISLPVIEVIKVNHSPASLFSSSCISNEAELSGSDSGSTTGAGKIMGSGGSRTCWTGLGEPGGGDALGVAAGDLLLGGDEVGLAFGVGSGVLTNAGLC